MWSPYSLVNLVPTAKSPEVLEDRSRELMARLGVDLDGRGNIAVDETYMSSVPGVFAAGDSKRGASLVVWAIREGRQCARAIDEYLMGSSELPR
mgnify:CR=1 FL=1